MSALRSPSRPARRCVDYAPLSLVAALALVAAAGAAQGAPPGLGGRDGKKPALSYGKGKCGKLEGGVALECTGENYEAFSGAACVLGRNYVHPLVKAVVEDAYRAVAEKTPGRTWQYGETGLAEGGPFWPHRTHQAGVSVDFFVPLVDEEGEPAPFPIRPTEAFGYGVVLDAAGKTGDLRVDFRAYGEHLLALDEAAEAHGLRIKTIIVTPDYHDALLRAVPELRKRLYGRFMKREAWVRHDEHYHVDFLLPKKLRRPLQCRAR